MCYTLACMCGLETMALTGKHQEKLQVCANNWMRRIVGAKRVDKRRLDELRVEVEVNESYQKKLTRSRVKRARHVDRL